jgi:hypothetical protein
VDQSRRQENVKGSANIKIMKESKAAALAQANAKVNVESIERRK